MGGEEFNSVEVKVALSLSLSLSEVRNLAGYRIMLGDLVDALAAGNISAARLRVSYRHLYISRYFHTRVRHLNTPLSPPSRAPTPPARNQTGLHARANYTADIGPWRSDISLVRCNAAAWGAMTGENITILTACLINIPYHRFHFPFPSLPPSVSRSLPWSIYL